MPHNVSVPVTRGYHNHSTVRRVTRRAGLLFPLIAVLLTGCSQIVIGTPEAAPDGMVMSAKGQLPKGPLHRPTDPDAGPASVRGGADTPDDRFAAAVVTGIEQYWRQEFPARFGRRWANIQDFMAADP